MTNNTRELIFNDQPGNRNTVCIARILWDNKIFTLKEAEEMKLCVVEHLCFFKKGKWSSNTWKVTVRSAKLIVCMSDDVEEDRELPLNGIIRATKEKCDEIITEEEAAIFFEKMKPHVATSIDDIVAANNFATLQKFEFNKEDKDKLHINTSFYTTPAIHDIKRGRIFIEEQGDKIIAWTKGLDLVVG